MVHGMTSFFKVFCYGLLYTWPMSYVIPANPIEITVEVKKSKFIGFAAYAADRTAVMALLEMRKQRYGDARHHCWAYLFGDPRQPKSVAMNDDGEPNGTAGKPILNVLQHKDVGDVVVIVSRYFGGIKLGAGGLVRAYSQAAQEAIASLSTTQKVEFARFVVDADFKHEGLLRGTLEQMGGELLTCSYEQQVKLVVDIPVAQAPQWFDLCQGLHCQIDAQP